MICTKYLFFNPFTEVLKLSDLSVLSDIETSGPTLIQVLLVQMSERGLDLVLLYFNVQCRTECPVWLLEFLEPLLLTRRLDGLN